jgi:glycosyltransferase involved in cell wall biosynthesis
VSWPAIVPDPDAAPKSFPEKTRNSMLKIAIDLTALMPKATGVDVYLLQLVRHLARMDRENRYSIFVNAGDRRKLDVATRPNLAIHLCHVRPRPMRLLFQQCALPLVSTVSSYDVIHSPSFLMPMWRGRARHLLTVHDMTFFSMPELHSRLHRGTIFCRAVRESIRRADLINVPSDAIRRDLLRLAPEVRPVSVRVTPWGVDTRFSPAPLDESTSYVARLGFPHPYILYLGSIEPRKNLSTLIEGYRRLVVSGQIDARLVLAGAPGWDTQEVRRRAEAPELRGQVYFPGYISDEHLPWIYRGASVFVYPSLYEGFGFPPLEAMACGVPVVASRGSAIEENLCGAADLVDPNDPEAIASAMRRLLVDSVWRQQRVLAGLQRASEFRWEETARLVLDCYQELGARRDVR